MMVVMREGATPEERAEIARILADQRVGVIPIAAHTAIGDVWCVSYSSPSPETRARLTALPAVDRVIPVTTPYQLASRALIPERTIIQVGKARIGGLDPVVIAGPCSVENEEQITEAAQAARAAGAQLLRGGAFKPRSSPYSFQGLGLPGLELLARAGAAVGLPIVTEVMEPALIEAVAEHADVLQIGARNMQNYPLLRAVGRARRPVLLKRGLSATIEEWLLAAEYILAEGNPNVMLCERGIRSYDTQTRNLLDLTCVPLLRGLTHLPIIVDPSHATGRRDLVLPMGVAAVAAGADGLIVEMSPYPDEALSDSDQTIDPATLRQLVRRSQLTRAALAEADEMDREGLGARSPAAARIARDAGELVGSDCW